MESCFSHMASQVCKGIVQNNELSETVGVGMLALIKFRLDNDIYIYHRTISICIFQMASLLYKAP